MRIVFDTNIFLATMHSQGSLCRELFLKIAQKNSDHQLFISPGILTELNEKAHEMIQQKYISTEIFQRFIKVVYKRAWFVTTKEQLKIIKADPDDDKILECAVACNADLIITMDHHLLKLKTFRTTGIVHPKTFLHIVGK